MKARAHSLLIAKESMLITIADKVHSSIPVAQETISFQFLFYLPLALVTWERRRGCESDLNCIPTSKNLATQSLIIRILEIRSLTHGDPVATGAWRRSRVPRIVQEPDYQ